MPTYYVNNAFPGWREKAVAIVPAKDKEEALRLINERLSPTGRKVLFEDVHEAIGLVFLNGPRGFGYED